MLSGEESGFAVGLDGGLFEGGDVGVEVFDRGGGDGDEAGVAQDAVAGGEVGFLLEDIVVFGGLGGVFDLSDFGALGLVGDVLDFLLADVTSGLIGACGGADQGELPPDPTREPDG